MTILSMPNDPIPGAGVDASVSQRPGVPMESDPPRPAGFAHWAEPERQRDPGNVLKRKGLAELTPVFGTSVPPRGISGVMRRAAYEIPEHYTTHWLVLLLADRVDAVEHGHARWLALAVPTLAVGGVATLALLRYRREQRSRWSLRKLLNR
jgi:hypothetical protein